MKLKLDEAVEVCRLYFPKEPISRQYIRTPSKKECHTRPRWFVMGYLREAGFSFPQIAHMVGLRDHTSVMHGVKKAHGLWGQGLFQNLYLQRNPPKGYGPIHDDQLYTFENGKGWVFKPEPLRAAS